MLWNDIAMIWLLNQYSYYDQLIIYTKRAIADNKLYELIWLKCQLGVYYWEREKELKRKLDVHSTQARVYSR